MEILKRILVIICALFSIFGMGYIIYAESKKINTLQIKSKGILPAHKEIVFIDNEPLIVDIPDKYILNVEGKLVETDSVTFSKLK